METPQTFARAAMTAEKLIGDNNLRPIAFLEQGLRIAQSVVQVVVPSQGLGTGFMVSPDAMLTNHHVLEDPDAAATSLARFNYAADIDGSLLPSFYAKCRPDLLFVTSPELDFTLVAVEGSPGVRFGVVPMLENPAIVGRRVNIIQHPNGEPKQIALVDNEIVYSDGNIVQYLTDTLPGSSGSPVFDDEWRLVALHHSGGWIPEPSSESTHFRNEGIATSSILAELRSLGLA